MDTILDMYESYEKKRPKHETTENYFYPARQLVKCMMRAYDLNFDNYSVITEMTGTKQIPTLHVCSPDKSELK